MNGNKRYTSKIALRVTMDAYEEDDAIEILSDLFSPGDFYGVTIEKCELISVEQDDRE